MNNCLTHVFARSDDTWVPDLGAWAEEQDETACGAVIYSIGKIGIIDMTQARATLSSRTAVLEFLVNRILMGIGGRGTELRRPVREIGDR